jgi:hypothetical protein
MPHSDKSIFLKCWLWSVIVGCLIPAVFWIFVDVANLFHNDGSTFLAVLLFLSIVGEYLGAGLVGWRLVEKYLISSEKKFLKSYFRLSLITFVVAIIIVYSPLSPLGLLWSLVPPLCVMKILSKINPQPKVAKRNK